MIQYQGRESSAALGPGGLSAVTQIKHPCESPTGLNTDMWRMVLITPDIDNTGLQPLRASDRDDWKRAVFT